MVQVIVTNGITTAQLTFAPKKLFNDRDDFTKNVLKKLKIFLEQFSREQKSAKFTYKILERTSTIMPSESIPSTTLVLGASGNTGRRLVEQLLAKEQNVRAIVRSKDYFRKIISENDNLKIIEAAVLDMKDAEFLDAVKGCDTVVSCLGHNMTLKGIFGKPRKLVTGAVEKSCKTIEELHPQKPIKFILMGSNGVDNPNGMDDRRTRTERLIISCLRTTIPPHKDNEEAAAFLSRDIGKENTSIEWVVVRPDDLIEGDVSDYEVLSKPKPGCLFGAGQTTRANVAAFMVDLILNDDTWKKWIYEMPMPLNS